MSDLFGYLFGCFGFVVVCDVVVEFGYGPEVEEVYGFGVEVLLGLVAVYFDAVCVCGWLYDGCVVVVVE